jgi:excisionase family DNA binding protein
MDDLLTTRQVQEFLKVDRITVYRMLRDGRIKGVKVGQQWRFTRREIENLLSSEKTADEGANLPAGGGFPTHCVQTIQDLFSDVSQIGGLVVDMNGNPLTEISQPCALCQLVQSTPNGKKACRASWQLFAQQSQSGSRFFTCHAGLQSIGAPIFEKNEQVGLFLAGEFYWNVPDRREEAGRLRRLASTCPLPLEKLQEAAAGLPVIAASQQSRAEEWPKSVARAIQSILHERGSFMERLQQIASLTQIQ